MPQWDVEAMTARLTRYADLQPCLTAHLDTETSGSTEKEDFTIIGPGVRQSAGQHMHLPEEHGFTIRGARQPFGCVHPQHSHDTAEVFVVHSGHWRLHFGPSKEDGSLDVAPGDVASVPIHLFRGFSKLDDGKGFLWMPLGQGDPGEAMWAPAVFEANPDLALKLAKGGRLIDTTSGTYELKDVESEGALVETTLAEWRTPPLARLLECVVRPSEMRANEASPLAREGVEEAGVIVPRQTSDGFPPGPITGWWPHDLNLRRLTLQTGAYVPMHARKEAEVLFVQSGTLEVSWAEGELFMGAGDTLSVPVGLEHAFRNTASAPAELFVVRGTEDPKMPVFASAPVAAELVPAATN